MATIQTNSKRGTINEGINLNQGRDFSDLWAGNIYEYCFIDNKDFLQVSFSGWKTFLSRGWCFVKYNKANEPFTWNNADEGHWMKCELTQNTIGDTLSGIGYLYIEVVAWMTDTGSTTFDGSDYFSIRFEATMPTPWPHIGLLYQINATTGVILNDYRKHREGKFETIVVENTLNVLWDVNMWGDVNVAWSITSGTIISNGQNITNIINSGGIDFWDGSDGALLVTTGNTVTLPLTKIYKYTTLTVQSWGTLRFTGDGSFWAKILVQWAVTIAGTIECRWAINKDGGYYYKDVKEIIMTGAGYNNTIVWWFGWAIVPWVWSWGGGKWWDSWVAWTWLWGSGGGVSSNWQNGGDSLTGWGWGWGGGGSTVNWWLSWTSWWALNGGNWGNGGDGTLIWWMNPWWCWGSWGAWFNTWAWWSGGSGWVWRSASWTNWSHGGRWGNWWDSGLSWSTGGNGGNWWSSPDTLSSSWGNWWKWGNAINWNWGNWGNWWNTNWWTTWNWGNWGNSRYWNWGNWGSSWPSASWNPVFIWIAGNWWEWLNWWNWGNAWSANSSTVVWNWGNWGHSKPWNVWLLIVAWWTLSFTGVINAQWGNGWNGGNGSNININSFWWNWGNGGNWSNWWDIVILSNISIVNTWSINNLWWNGGMWGNWWIAFSAPFNGSNWSPWLPGYPWKKVVSLIYN